jgi:sugar lactone lactonase YvrE
VAWVAIDRSGGNDKSQRSGALVTTVSEYKNVDTVAGVDAAGNVSNMLNSPNGVALDAEGDVYVADTYNHRVQKFASGCTNTSTSTCTGVTVAGGNLAGSAATQLFEPGGVALDAEGNVFVADTRNHRVQKFVSGCVNTETSKCAGVTVAGGNGPGANPNKLYEPLGLALDAAGNVYVADTYNYRVQRWEPGATAGVTVAGGNGPGANPNQLSPVAVAVDSNLNLYVVDAGNHRVQKWPAVCTSTCSGVTVAGGNGQGSAANQLNLPFGVAFDASDNVYVVDTNNHRVQRWAQDATGGVTVAGGNVAGSAPPEFYYPGGVTVDANRNVYVADTLNHRVQKWSP